MTFQIVGLAGSNGFHDPVFDKYPLEQWLAEGKQSRLHWSVEIPRPELSTHQRLRVRVVTHVDGRELEKRRGTGTFLILLQVRDAAGHVWQDHAEVDPQKAPQNVQASEFNITHFAFILPGEYSVSVAVCDTLTLEHGVAVRRLHVAPLHAEPLQGAWEGLPPVEFIGPVEGPPDIWYLPEIRERLHVTLHTAHPLHIQILVNTTPSERALASATTMRRNMSVAIPALKVLTQVEVPGSTVDAALLDLTHRRVPFDQKNFQRLDWAKMRNYFVDVQPGLIDVGTLQGQRKMLQFFRDEIARRLMPQGDAIPVVIVISGPAFFGNQEAVEPISFDPDTGRRLFYIRYRPPSGAQRFRDRPGMRPPSQPVPVLDALPPDDLERTLEPLGARIFDATSAEQFRRILAAILEEASKL